MDNIRMRINSRLEEKLEKHGTKTYQKLLEAMRYSLLSGGKRIRPLILYNVGVELKIPEDILIDLGVAVEMMHSASLIHDDLPAIDDDDYRRGKPSCHKVFGEGIALVAGDALMLLSIEILNEINIDEVVKVKLVRELLESAGMNGMMAGEAEDIDVTGKDKQLNLNRILSMYEKKTGALFGFSFSAPAICIEDDELALNMKEIGKKFGVSFQIFDDLKDLTGSFEEIGKTPKKDEIMNKPTVPRLLGTDEARKLADDLYTESIRMLRMFGTFDNLIILLNDMREEIEKR